MKLQGKVDPQATVPVSIADPFVVEVGAVTRHVLQRINLNNTVKELDPRSRAMVDKTNDVGVFVDTVAAYVRGWRYLTPETLMRLLRLPVDVEIDVSEPAVETLPDGRQVECIPCDHRKVVHTGPLSTIADSHGFTLPQLLWFKADVSKFQTPISTVAEEWERAEEAHRTKKSET